MIFRCLLAVVALAIAGGEAHHPAPPSPGRARVPVDAPAGTAFGMISRIEPGAIELYGDNGSGVAFLLSPTAKLYFAGASPLVNRLRAGQSVMVGWVRQDGPPIAVRVDVLAPAW